MVLVQPEVVLLSRPATAATAKTAEVRRRSTQSPVAIRSKHVARSPAPARSSSAEGVANSSCKALAAAQRTVGTRRMARPIHASIRAPWVVATQLRPKQLSIALMVSRKEAPDRAPIRTGRRATSTSNALSFQRVGATDALSTRARGHQVRLAVPQFAPSQPQTVPAMSLSVRRARRLRWLCQTLTVRRVDSQISIGCCHHLALPNDFGDLSRELKTSLRNRNATDIQENTYGA